jgi:hypothetical protein
LSEKLAERIHPQAIIELLHKDPPPPQTIVTTVKVVSPYLLPAEAAKYMRCSVGRLAAMRLYGRGPKCSQDGGKILYKISDLDDYINAPHFHALDGHSLKFPGIAFPLHLWFLSRKLCPFLCVSSRVHSIAHSSIVR